MPELAVTPSGAAVVYQDLGPRDGPVFVHLGGLGSATSVIFAPVVAHPLLAGRARHLLVDLLGSGWSDHDDDGFGYTIEDHAGTVLAVLDHLSLRDVTLVGHSLGGSIAVCAAATRPELVSRLVVAEPNLDPGVGTFSVEVAAQDEAEFAAHGYDRAVAAALADSALDYVRTLRRWSPRGLHRTSVSLIAERPVTFRQQLAALDRPRRYIGGELSPENLADIAECGCDVRVVPRAGHVMMEDNLDGFVEAIVADWAGG